MGGWMRDNERVDVKLFHLWSHIQPQVRDATGIYVEYSGTCNRGERMARVDQLIR
jgi:hypothetical protein